MNIGTSCDDKLLHVLTCSSRCLCTKANGAFVSCAITGVCNLCFHCTQVMCVFIIPWTIAPLRNT